MNLQRTEDRPEEVVEFDVAFAGVITDVSFVSIDPSGRSDLLKIIDQALNRGSIAPMHSLQPGSHRISIHRDHLQICSTSTQ
ncbi:unnamed protein product, partial [Haemonchus placei]|uniref:Uncharacterized protein n=1 Tax=Haemonchus placei TaxID=6290 RepID=A0A0N4WQX6_HAEPC